MIVRHPSAAFGENLWIAQMLLSRPLFTANQFKRDGATAKNVSRTAERLGVRA